MNPGGRRFFDPAGPRKTRWPPHRAVGRPVSRYRSGPVSNLTRGTKLLTTVADVFLSSSQTFPTPGRAGFSGCLCPALSRAPAPACWPKSGSGSTSRRPTRAGCRGWPAPWWPPPRAAPACCPPPPGRACGRCKPPWPPSTRSSAPSRFRPSWPIRSRQSTSTDRSFARPKNRQSPRSGTGTGAWGGAAGKLDFAAPGGATGRGGPAACAGRTSRRRPAAGSRPHPSGRPWARRAPDRWSPGPAPAPTGCSALTNSALAPLLQTDSS